MEDMQADKYLIFSVDGHIYSVNFKNVKQIIPAEMPERIPDFPDYVLGTVKYENKYIPVIDLTRRFGLDGKDPMDRQATADYYGLRERRADMLEKSVYKHMREEVEGDIWIYRD